MSKEEFSLYLFLSLNSSAISVVNKDEALEQTIFGNVKREGGGLLLHLLLYAQGCFPCVGVAFLVGEDSLKH